MNHCDPITFLYGTMKEKRYVVGEVAEVDCDDGFSLEGDPPKCLKNGTWNFTPNCQSKRFYGNFFFTFHLFFLFLPLIGN